MPGAPNVSVSVAVPFGSHSDPRGEEGLAHFTEPMLFPDHAGPSEQEVRDAIEGLGGRRNGFTAADHTWYYATIDREHGLFAIEWLSYISTVDDYRVQTISFGLKLVAALTLLITYLSRFPRKLLVFLDHIRIKSLAYRSLAFKPEDLEGISLRRFHKVWLSRDLFRCFPMTLGLVGPGVFLRPRKGQAYFLPHARYQGSHRGVGHMAGRAHHDGHPGAAAQSRTGKCGDARACCEKEGKEKADEQIRSH